ncbi:XRE family transcriptional regulator [Bacillus thuringiensis]|uniref:XRE family transcriptional regulator n=3 Tax=Bacillus cereus group TaxID=86661 RepID=A0A2B9DQ19_BACCE|nr:MULTISPECIES: helix-turn-helix transcriptional regulator [Bacillus cereus group]ARJ20487.1 transcriptional regulator [Bacillus mycoides]PER40813.1 XRE family transcriptional regulator [Bacillus thuringiensis]PEU85316.1 XRE family transcriptional regulator [Bacillus thuringiensis]PFI05807.1 XRE family transcriptional regulator [Bacillus thuringiensis]PFW34618.1 XRE family transcriptional regulator [Bacillus thuringiensis]
MELKERIRFLRKERNLKQDELGKAIGVNAASVSKFETGLKSPSRETLQRMADFFNVTADYLLGRSNNRQLNEMLDQKYNVLKNRLDQLPEEHQEILLQNMITMMESFEKINNLKK